MSGDNHTSTRIALGAAQAVDRHWFPGDEMRREFTLLTDELVRTSRNGKIQRVIGAKDVPAKPASFGFSNRKEHEYPAGRTHYDFALFALFSKHRFTPRLEMRL